MAPIDPKYWQKRSRRRREENPEFYMLRRAKHRAKRKDVPFDLELADIVIPDRCPIFGIKLDAHTVGLVDTSPTLDRIRGSMGYIKGNIEVISWKANRLKGEATPEQLRILADYYDQKGRKPITVKNKKSTHKAVRRQVV